MPVAMVVRHGANALAAAHLLANWLRARLGAVTTMEANGGSATLFPDRVALAVGDCEIELTARGQQIRVQASTPDRCELPFFVPLSRGSDGDLVGAAIDLGS
jgi:hypothetical protein